MSEKKEKVGRWDDAGESERRISQRNSDNEYQKSFIALSSSFPTLLATPLPGKELLSFPPSPETLHYEAAKVKNKRLKPFSKVSFNSRHLGRGDGRRQQSFKQQPLLRRRPRVQRLEVKQKLSRQIALQIQHGDSASRVVFRWR